MTQATLDAPATVVLPRQAASAKDFKGRVEPDWFPGGGDFGVLNDSTNVSTSACFSGGSALTFSKMASVMLIAAAKLHSVAKLDQPSRRLPPRGDWHRGWLQRDA